MIRFLSLLTIIGLFASCDRTDSSRLKIIGGKPSAEHHPWFVQLVDNKNSAQGFCGGTLVAPRIVITAAHCMEPEFVRNLHVVLGMADGVNLQLNKPVKVQGIIVHPNYAMTNTKNDIAVLYLEDYSGLQFERPVVPLPFSRETANPEQNNKNAKIVGLGNTTSLGQLFDGIIREVDVPLVDLKACSDKYGDIDSKQICAGDMAKGGVDSCQGDSGGPLVAKNSAGQWNLVGVVSYGDGCAQKMAPGVYTRVAAYSQWIDESVAVLTKPLSAAFSDEDITRILKTNCTSQFGYIPFEQAAGNNTRRSIYGMDVKTFKVTKADKDPIGSPIDTCEITVNGKKIVAEWIRVGASPRTPNSKVVVVATVDGKDIYVSQPQTLVYHQDSLTCSTSEGEVSLADQRQFTYVVFRDVFYGLAEAVDQPGDNQTTWGCSIGDASVEVYELSKPQNAKSELAVRIHHKSLGTVSVKLVRMDNDAQSTASISWSDAQHGNIKIVNQSKEDIFTWKLSCPSNFKLKLADGTEREAVPLPSGSGFDVTLEAGVDKDGTIRAGSTLTLQLTSLGQGSSRLNGCTINDVLMVELSSH